MDISYLVGAVDVGASVTNGSQASRAIGGEFWTNIFEGGLFGRVAQAAGYLVIPAIAFRGYLIAKEGVKDGAWTIVNPMIAVLLAVALLANNGAQAKVTVLGLRNFTSSITDGLIDNIAGDFQSGTARDLTNKLQSQEAFRTFQTEISRCPAASDSSNCNALAASRLEAAVYATSPPDPEAIKALEEVQRIVSQPTTEKNNDALNNLGGALFNPGEYFRAILAGLLTGLAIMFFLSIEIAMLMYGFGFSIAVALGIFNWANLLNWLSNFWALANAKLGFALISGLVLYLERWAQTTNNPVLANGGLFVIELLLAVAAPFLTFLYIQGSTLSFANAMMRFNQGLMSGAGRSLKSAPGAVMSTVRSIRGSWGKEK